MDLFGSVFKKGFENTKNTKIVLFENCSCYLNLVFVMVFVFFVNKNKIL